MFNVCCLLLNVIFVVFIFNKVSQKSDLINQLQSQSALKRLQFNEHKTPKDKIKDLFDILGQNEKLLSYARNEKPIGKFDGKKYGAIESTYFLRIGYLDFLSKLQHINKDNLAFTINNLVIESKDYMPLSTYIKFITLTYEEN